MSEDTYMFNVRMGAEDKKKLEELAEENNRSMSSQIVWMIRQEWLQMNQVKHLEKIPVAINQDCPQNQ